MKHKTLPLAITWVMTLLLYPTAAVFAANSSQVGKQVLALDQRRTEAQVQKDFPFLESVMANDLTFVHASGEVQSKPEFLSDLKSGRRLYKSIKYSDIHVRVFGRAAVITGQCAITVVYGPKENNLFLLVTEVYVNRDGRWQIVAYQSTNLKR